MINLYKINGISRAKPQLAYKIVMPANHIPSMPLVPAWINIKLFKARINNITEIIRVAFNADLNLKHIRIEATSSNRAGIKPWVIPAIKLNNISIFFKLYIRMLRLAINIFQIA
jgi:hypothetical protein